MGSNLLLKKISWRALFVAIGFLVALVYIHIRNQRSQFNYATQKEAQKWKDIGEIEGKKLLANYMAEQRNIWPHYFRLRTGDKEEILRGFWIDKKMLDEIQRVVDQITPTPVINGYSVFFGKWDENAKRYYSLVVRATEAKQSTPATASETSGVGSYFDMVDPCPDNCGNETP